MRTLSSSDFGEVRAFGERPIATTPGADRTAKGRNDSKALLTAMMIDACAVLRAANSIRSWKSINGYVLNVLMEIG